MVRSTLSNPVLANEVVPVCSIFAGQLMVSNEVQFLNASKFIYKAVDGFGRVTFSKLEQFSNALVLIWTIATLVVIVSSFIHLQPLNKLAGI